MKYIKLNLEPLIIGFAVAILIIYLTNKIEDIIVKIAIIKYK
jgi:hypothetical protein